MVESVNEISEKKTVGDVSQDSSASLPNNDDTKA